jgi:adenosylcobyric acid synthase
MGSTISDMESPVCMIGDSTDGYYLNSATWGSYIHGIFDNPSVVQNILNQTGTEVRVEMNFLSFKDSQYNKLAELIRECVDMDFIYNSMV